MISEILALRERIRADLTRDAFSFCPRLEAQLTTAQVAHELGRIIDVSKLLAEVDIPIVQTLVPRETNEVERNRYSGNYGLEEFPLHSDLAHWAVPPHYFMLRCIVGTEDVLTHVLSSVPIVDRIGASSLKRAVFTVRKKRVGHSRLVRALSDWNGLDIMRWDPLFLRPLNEAAQKVALAITNSGWDAKMHKILLQYPGDTLLIDNWRSLHGRAAVQDVGRRRQIERVYMAEVYA